MMLSQLVILPLKKRSICCVSKLEIVFFSDVVSDQLKMLKMRNINYENET